MDRIINGNVVDVMNGNMNAEWKVNRRETVICFCNVDWLSRYNDDWLSAYGVSPWHYFKHKVYLSEGVVAEENGWRAYWDVREHYNYSPFLILVRYYDSMKFADFLLSDAHDEKEGY